MAWRAEYVPTTKSVILWNSASEMPGRVLSRPLVTLSGYRRCDRFRAATVNEPFPAI